MTRSVHQRARLDSWIQDSELTNKGSEDRRELLKRDHVDEPGKDPEGALRSGNSCGGSN